MFAHAMGHSVFRGTAGAAEGERGGGFAKEEGGRKRSNGVWWPHVTVAVRAKHRCRGWKSALSKYKGLGGGLVKTVPQPDNPTQITTPPVPAMVPSGPNSDPDLQP